MAGIGSLVVRQVTISSGLARARFKLVMPAFEVSAAAYVASLTLAAPAGLAYVNAVRPILQGALQQAEAGLANLDKFTPQLEGAWRIPVSAVRGLSTARHGAQYAELHDSDKLVSNSSWVSPAADAFRQVAAKQTEATEKASEKANQLAAAHTAFGAAAVVATAMTVTQLAVAVNLMANTQFIISNALTAPAGAASLIGFTQMLNARIMIAQVAAKALAAAYSAGAGAIANGL